MSAVSPLYRVLFVCAGNTCRSPLAAAALRQALGSGGERVEIRSAGVLASPGNPATTPAIDVGSRHGLDLRAHHSERLGIEQVEAADLILILDRSEQDAVSRLSPAAASRTYLLSDYGSEAPSGESVPDPFGGSREAYEECLRRILEHTQRIASVISREVQARREAEAASRDRGAA